jgi:DNA polymerase-3 subunit beta
MLKVNRRTLLGVLRHACKVIGRPGIPALSGVLLETTDYRNPLGFRVTSTDLETTYSNVVEASEPGSDAFRALVPAKALKDAIGKLSDDVIELEHDSDGSRFTVIRPNGARISFRTLPVDDFPSIPDVEGIGVSINADAFRSVVGTVLPFASGDTARPTLTGVAFEYHEGGGPEAGLLAIATDSYRLGVAQERAALGTAEIANVIVPAHALKYALAELGKDSGPVVMTFGKDSSTVELPSGARWTVRDIYGQFPNWRQLMPETAEGRGGAGSFEGMVTFDLAETLEAVTTAGQIAGDNVPMRLEVNGHVRISASSPESGSFEQILAGAHYSGPDMTVAFNPGYFRECVAATNGAPMALKDGLKPATFGNLERDGSAVLLMPVRLPAPTDTVASWAK